MKKITIEDIGTAKRIPISEFRELGYLQEVNRRFLHPLGLSLTVVRNGNGFQLGSILDFREDSDGVCFGADSRPDTEAFQRKIDFIDSEFKTRGDNRKKLLGGIEETLTKTL